MWVRSATVIRVARFQFVQGRAAGGHGQRLGPDELPATHIERRVTDDNDLIRLQVFAEHTTPALQGGMGDVITVFVVIRKTTHHEFFQRSVGAAI